MNEYIGRIVVLLTPIFAGVSGWIATRAAEILPGMPSLDEAEMTALFVAGAGVALGAVYKWLDNLGDHELAVENKAALETTGEPHVPVGMSDQPER